MPGISRARLETSVRENERMIRRRGATHYVGRKIKNDETVFGINFVIDPSMFILVELSGKIVGILYKIEH
jgi:hypothetical protein